MIVTLTANPSHRPHGHAGRPLLERGAVHRAASVISQAGGKGVNISRAVGRRRRPLDRGPPGPDRTTRSCSSCSRAGIDCRPGRAPPATLRVNLTITEPDGTTTKLNSPGAAVTAESWPPHRRRSADRAAAGRLGRAGRLPAARAPPSRLVRRAGRRPARHRRPGRGRHQRRAAARAGRRGCPTSRPAPDEAERRGARLVHRRATPTSSRPTRPPPPRPRAASSTAASRRCSPRSARAGAVLVTADGAWHATPPPTDGGQHRRRRRLQPLRLPPRRPARRRPRPTTRARRRLRQRGRRTSRHDHPATPRRSTSRARLGPPTSTSPRGG